MSSQPPHSATRGSFKIAIICALPLETDAVEALFDQYWEDEASSIGKVPGDPNSYSFGVLGSHVVVLAHAPSIGKVNAAMVATYCRMSFPNIKLALVVGICGVAPFDPSGREIVLGDVVISDRIIQYDFGWLLSEGFVRKESPKDSLGRPNQEIGGVLAKLKTLRGRQQLSSKMIRYLELLRQEVGLQAEYPGCNEDRLFDVSYHHKEHRRSCEQIGCNGKLVRRRRLETLATNPVPAIHLGVVASGDSVMKSGEERDRIAGEEGVLAFEMEGAGVRDTFPCIVIKGACDYADSHKGGAWQRYAAATAAACTKAFLSFWSLSNVEDHPPLTHETRSEPASPCPFPENKVFVGRNDILEELRRLLLRRNCLESTLAGLGDGSKTHVTLRLACGARSIKPGYSVIWQQARRKAIFEQDCMKLAETFRCRYFEELEVEHVLRHHSASNGALKRFLVGTVDGNVEALQRSIHKRQRENFACLPTGVDGRILFTARSRHIPFKLPRTAVVELLQMQVKRTSNLLRISSEVQDELKDDKSVNQRFRIFAVLHSARRRRWVSVGVATRTTLSYRRTERRRSDYAG